MLFGKSFNSKSKLRSNTSCFNEKYALDTFSWVELDNESKTYGVKFQVFGFNKDLEFIDQFIDVPNTDLSLATSNAPESEAILGANDKVFI